MFGLPCQASFNLLSVWTSHVPKLYSRLHTEPKLYFQKNIRVSFNPNKWQVCFFIILRHIWSLCGRHSFIGFLTNIRGRLVKKFFFSSVKRDFLQDNDTDSHLLSWTSNDKVYLQDRDASTICNDNHRLY